MTIPAVIDKLSAEHVPYELLPHRHTETATAEARALCLTPGETAKTVVLRAGEELVRAVIPASRRVDLAKAKRTLGEPVEIVHEDVLAAHTRSSHSARCLRSAARPTGCSWTGGWPASNRSSSRREPMKESIRLRTKDLLKLTDAGLADLCAA
jgi:hypothetical protein